MLPTILFLIDTLERPGGTETHLHQLATRLEPKGYRPIVCSLSGDGAVLNRIAEAGVETWPVHIGRLYMPAGRRTAHGITRRASECNVRAVHTFHFKSDWMGVSAARALGCPLISSRRDLGFQQNATRRAIYRWINGRTDAFIAPSGAVRDSVLAQGNVRRDTVRVIYNGLDMSRFLITMDRRTERASLGVPADAQVVGMVGNLRAVKDHPTLLRAMARVAADHPKAHLVLLGEGPEEQNLRTLAASLGIGDRVTFAGSGRDVPRALAAMDAFALSSTSEGLSNALIEAMAAGLPIVATSVGGNPECVADGQTGFLTPPGDPDSLADRLGRILDNPSMAGKMGEAGRKRCRRLFDVEEMVNQTVELYDALGCRTREGASRAGH